MKPGDVKPRFFATPAAFRQWLQKNHDSVSELWVGFRKKATGKGPRKNKVTEFAPRFGSDWVDPREQNRRRSQRYVEDFATEKRPKMARRWDAKTGSYFCAGPKASITWPQSVDQALCFGWIDGIRKTIDEESYMIRFTPRKRGSVWSAVNTKRAHELIELGLMQPAGALAFAKRDEEKTRQYSFERENVALSQAQLKQFRDNRKAWQFWQAQPPSYRKTVAWWVISAKQEATRQRRLAALIADSEAGQRVGLLERRESSAK
jgi:uncharacterized protein YdeI (YjbR/CyaY-like superfamily)